MQEVWAVCVRFHDFVCACVLKLKAVSVNEQVVKLHCLNRRCSGVSGGPSPVLCVPALCCAVG